MRGEKISMTYETFLKNLQELLCTDAAWNKPVKTFVSRVLKNNGTERDTMTIQWEGDNLAPVIYLDSFYEEARQGKPITEIAGEIVETCARHRRSGYLDPEFFENYEKAKGRIACRLVNYSRNKKNLEDLPFTRFLDLAVVYYYLVEDKIFEHATILIHNNHMKSWGVCTEELHEIAMKNTSRLLPPDFFSMSDMFGMLSVNRAECAEAVDSCPLYVLTNKEKCYGAAALLDQNVLKDIYCLLNEEYYVIPSSLHECIIVPASSGIEGKDMQHMVYEINRSELEPEDILSDSVYRFYKSDEKLHLTNPAPDVISYQM